MDMIIAYRIIKCERPSPNVVNPAVDWISTQSCHDNIVRRGQSKLVNFKLKQIAKNPVGINQKQHVANISRSAAISRLRKPCQAQDYEYDDCNCPPFKSQDRVVC